jgi:hypothetical protein
MGCTKSKNNYNENKDKKTQLIKLNEILKSLNYQITDLKQTELLEAGIKKKACFYAHMIIVIKWIIKVVEVNQEVKSP